MRGSLQRTILLGGAVMLGAFAVTALVLRRADASDQTLSIVGGAMAYAFLGFVAVLLVRNWRRGEPALGRAASAFVARHPRVRTEVGDPVELRLPHDTGRGGRGPGQATVTGVVSGPMGEAQVDLVMARLGRTWEVLSADLLSDGERVSLTAASGDAV